MAYHSSVGCDLGGDQPTGYATPSTCFHTPEITITPFFQLSEEEQRQFMARDRANLDALGMKAISMVDCSQSDDEWEYIGVESWPSMEAVKEREKFENEELQISRYVEYKVHLGFEQSFEDYGQSQ